MQLKPVIYSIYEKYIYISVYERHKNIRRKGQNDDYTIHYNSYYFGKRHVCRME